MHRHNNYNNKEEPLMPTKKPRKRDDDGKFVSEKAVVSRVGEYEENPVPEKSGDVTTRHGSTIHYS
jgi:hypothetical protein